VGLTVLIAAGAARAADDKPASGSQDSKALDGLMHTTLKDVINHGADLYNSGDWNGCYRLWEGTLMSIKPLLAHRPSLQKAIETGLANAQQDPMLYQRAFVLRRVLDQVRGELKGGAPAGKDKPVTSPKPEDKKPVVTPKPKKTLWDRLGGEAGVTKIVDDTVNAAAADPKVDFFRHGKYKLDGAHIAKMKREIVEQVSENTGGPLKYSGPDMKKVHKGMGITNEQFDAVAGHLKKALEKNNVSSQDAATVLAAINTYRTQIIEPKKPEDKKPVDKKPEDKKPVDKKPVDKKPEDKKPVDKKPEDKKPEDKKPVDKKPVDKKPEDKKPATTGVGQAPPTAGASITGHVTFNGKPLAGGTVELVGATGKSQGKIGADGTFSVQGVKPGTYKVAISVQGVKNAPAIPARYSDADKSGITYQAKDGRQELNLDLQ
jgi:truncated hemoglobin YjbI